MSELRMPEINRVIIDARLTRDPDLKYLSSGQAVCSMGLAHSRHYKGEEKTTFFDVTCWGKTAEFAGEQLKKGRAIVIEGRLDMDEWEHEGRKRTKLKVTADRVKPLDWPDRPKETARHVKPGGGYEPAPDVQKDAPF